MSALESEHWETCAHIYQNIRIIGAGLVGATAAIALSRLENVVVKAFERSPGPREEGAWISFNVSGKYGVRPARPYLIP